MQSTEKWLPVVGHEARYEVSSMGRVRNIPYVDARGNVRGQRIKRPAADTSGHIQAKLTQDGKGRLALVHRLVLEAFTGQCPVGMEGCHNNGDPADNRLSNLRWDTKSGNQQDAVAHGTHASTARDSCPVGHELAAPNLTARHARDGKRSCWACDRERSEARNQGREFSVENANGLFEKIISGWTPTPMSDRTECPRRHALEGENLRKSQFEKRGQRSCRSCSIESSRAKRQNRPFSIAEADAVFHRLTGML